MATGAAERMSADYGLSITGYLGPGAGMLPTHWGRFTWGLRARGGLESVGSLQRWASRAQVASGGGSFGLDAA